MKPKILVPLDGSGLAERALEQAEKIAKALGRKFSANKDILGFSVTVENLSEGFKTFAILDGPQDLAQNH